MPILKLTDQQYDAVLAGVRLLATALDNRLVLPNDGDIGDILTCGGEHDGLAAKEIHTLADGWQAALPNVGDNVPAAYWTQDIADIPHGWTLVQPAHSDQAESWLLEVHFPGDDDQPALRAAILSLTLTLNGGV